MVINGEFSQNPKMEVKKLEFYELVSLYLWIQRERPSHFAKRAGVDVGNFHNWRKGKRNQLGSGTVARIRRAMLDKPVDRNHFAKEIGGFFEAFNEFERFEGLNEG